MGFVTRGARAERERASAVIEGLLVEGLRSEISGKEVVGAAERQAGEDNGVTDATEGVRGARATSGRF
jgi:hypothetical protein